MFSLPQFRAELHRQRLVADGQHVLVACSGGLDSVVLLHVLRFASDLLLRVSVAHFDHRMRESSASDADWVRGLCVAWAVPVYMGAAAEIPANEAAAREARYAFLESTADRIGADRIATAHQADDQVETVLFRMLRGTGLDGLAGIPPVRGRIIRPLLPFGRAQLEAYARREHLSWREDPSNQSRAYARNRIRWDVLPALEAQWPGTRRALLRIAEDAARTRRAWELVLQTLDPRLVIAQDADTIELARPLLLEYHPDIRARMMRRWFARLGQAPGRSGTAAIETFITTGESGCGIHLRGGLRAEREFDTIRLTRARKPVEADRPLWICSAEPGSGETTIGGTSYWFRWSIDSQRSNSNSVVIDPAAVRFPLAIRAWRPGDRIRLPIGSKKLKKLFAERRLGRERRRTMPVLVDTDGTVLWIPGLARAVSAQPLPDQSALCITVGDGESN